MPAVPAPTSLPDLRPFAEDFEAFHARFADLFGRSEPRRQAAKYLRGLLGSAERRNGWQMAEAMGDPSPDRMQHVLNRAHWSAVAARDRLLSFVRERFGDPEGIGILDETGFLKKGTSSVGVQRQYSGTAGRIENCQIGVFLGYASPSGRVLLDRALYLPRSWCDDAARREKARVPERVRFHTKPELAARMLRRSWAAGVPMGWVTGDEIYGNDPGLREAIAESGKRYVLAVGSATPVWAQRPATLAPGPARGGRGGRQRTRPQRAPGEPRATTVKALSVGWPPAQWHRLATSQGEKGPIEYDWAAARVVDSRRKAPTDELWLLARRSVSDPSEVAWYLSNAPDDVAVATLARVASARFAIEQLFEEAKGDVGLDHYEVRRWPAWHRHITLTMLALAWLASVRLRLAAEPDALAPGSHGVKKKPPTRTTRSRPGRSPKPAA